MGRFSCICSSLLIAVGVRYFQTDLPLATLRSITTLHALREQISRFFMFPWLLTSTVSTCNKASNESVSLGMIMLCTSLELASCHALVSIHVIRISLVSDQTCENTADIGSHSNEQLDRILEATTLLSRTRIDL